MSHAEVHIDSKSQMYVRYMHTNGNELAVATGLNTRQGAHKNIRAMIGLSKGAQIKVLDLTYGRYEVVVSWLFPNGRNKPYHQGTIRHSGLPWRVRKRLEQGLKLKSKPTKK